MLKVTIPKIVLMIVISVFCLHLSGVAAERECWDFEDGGPTFSGNYTYPPGWFPAFQYDPNNPDEIDRNSSVTIRVIGGFPPYTWQVSGNGFSLSEGQTQGQTNTLNANDTACGTATITVTDNYGVLVTGYVRCTTGQWVLKSNTCVLPGTGTLIAEYGAGAGCMHRYVYELIRVWQKQTQMTCENAGGDPTCEVAMDYCISRCDLKGYDCNTCIDQTHVMPCQTAPWGGYICICVGELAYYEWECK